MVATPTTQPESNFVDRLLMAIEAEECRRSLKTFIKAAWHIVEPGTPFIDGMPVDAMVDHLEALTRGEIRRLLINIPPRCSKSTIGNVMWRVWSWLQDPALRFMSASYSLDLSTRDNRRCRMLIESAWFQERFGHIFTLAEDQQQKRFFENSARGYQLATSVGGTVTGQGADALVIDDCHSAMEAYSDVERETALTFFREVWTNRLNNQETGRMLTIGQRIHETDVSGYILRERPDWVHLNLPAYYEPSRHCSTVIGWSDPRKEEGELLWPARFSKATLEGLKRDLGSTGFASQYQQSPVPSGGAIFRKEWFRYAHTTGDFYGLETPEGIVKHVPKEQCWTFSVADLAVSSKQDSDFTVVQTWAVTPSNELILIDQVRGHFDNPTQQRVIRQVYAKHHPDFVQVETVAFALSLVQQLRDKPQQRDETDFLVSAASPEALDRTLQDLLGGKGYLVMEHDLYTKTDDGYYIARIANEQVGYFTFAVTKQGYCTIIGPVAEEHQGFSIPLKEYHPVKDKVSRASTASVLMEGGQIYFLKSISDLPDIETELLTFPKGAHDDIVDDVSQAAEVVSRPYEPHVGGGAFPLYKEMQQQRETPHEFSAFEDTFNPFGFNLEGGY